MVASRTSGGPPGRCPVCGGLSRSEPSLAGDVTCPTCGHLLWLEPEEHRRPQVAYLCEYRMPLGEEFVSWIGGVSVRLGPPTLEEAEFLTGITTWDEAGLLKRLARDARSWTDVMDRWRLVRG